MPRLLLLASLMACTVGTEAALSDPTFEEFEAMTYREPWSGVYIVDGDTPVASREQLRAIWEQLYGQTTALVVDKAPDFRDSRWDGLRKRAITYCISDAFGANKQAVIEAMAAATDAGWETMADVDFVHVPAEDARCTPANGAVIFDVTPAPAGVPYLARAFFPHDQRVHRNILIASEAFAAEWTLTAILSHETGHALGFRHEHTRPEAGACFEDLDWRPLTPYDSASVMHYPQCNGTTELLAFSPLDRAGAAALYGEPGKGSVVPPLDTRRDLSDLVLDGQLRDLGSFDVEPGSVIMVSLTATDTADVAVRFDGAPTMASYACRTFGDVPGEECWVDVPVTAKKAYVGVYGFDFARFDLTVRYTHATRAPARLVINEILADPTRIDSNYDRVIDAYDDEFVEIVNVGGQTADLGGATISDAAGVRVTLPAGTALPPNETLLVYGGGKPAWLGSRVHVVTGKLYLNNTGDTVTVRDAAGAMLATATYGANAGFDVSVVRATELDANAPFVLHSEVSIIDASPGTRMLAQAF